MKLLEKGNTSIFKKLCLILKNTVFPPKCLVCKKFIGSAGTSLMPPLLMYLCKDCRADMHKISSPICLVCGVKFRTGEGQDHLCYDCIKHPKQFKTTRCLFVYEGASRKLIHAFKFNGQLRAGRLMGNLLLSAFESIWGKEKIDIITPVPLHIKRMRFRGFNQAYILIKQWNKNRAEDKLLQIEPKILIRTWYTTPQSGLGRRNRISNIKGAFKVKEPYKIQGKRILLVDDVITTGATVDECAGALMKAGAKHVDVLAFARAMPL